MTFAARLAVLSLAAPAVLGQSVSSAQRAPDSTPAQTGTARLAGRVFRAEASNRPPVARVVVSIGLGDGRGNRQTVTDDEGRFEFDGLPAGGYLLTASKAGWVTTHYGSPRPGRPPGVRVVLADGGKASVEIPIVPGSVIAGRIVDQDGQPMARQFPWLLERRLVGNRQMLARARIPYAVGFFERSTNDLGEFRLFGLPPGTYYLVLNPSITSGARLTTQEEVRWALQPPGTVGAQAPPPGPVAGYASVYYPGTTDPASSEGIVVGPGEVKEGLTFRVGFVPVARVEGIVRRPDGAPLTGTRLSMDARVPQVNLEGSSRSAAVDANGRFVFQNVPPGDYRLSARTTASPQAPLLWGQADVVVAGQDIQSVGITLAPAASVSGRLAFSGTTQKPPADLTVIRLQFTATEALAAALAGGGTGLTTHVATVEADGAFRVAGLPPDRYTVSATWPGIRGSDGTTGWWLTSILVGGKNIGDQPVEVRANEELPDVTIGFRDRIGAIEGLLTDATGRPAPEYFVLAFPVERTSWTTTSSRAVPAVRPGTDGRFRVAGLPAGQYYVAVVTAVESGDAMDPAFLEAIVPSAIRVTVRDGEILRQDLRVGR